MSKGNIKIILIRGFVFAIIIHGIYHSILPQDLSNVDHPSNFGGIYMMNLQGGSAVVFPVVASVVELAPFEISDSA